ncbi:MAG: 3-isopropylmalate dehydratase large subunit, partial [Phascolarctobacterium sp.]|nr:3-isopropylmalate dehydratase large subunit [Phascolarctobacterium sp.]
RFTICNMAIEAGAKNGIFPVDEKTIAYLESRVTDRTWEAVTADEDAEYAQEITMELDKLVPVVAYPHLPENTHPASEGREIKIDQVVVGSCTNGRLEDLAQAAEILKGQKVCDGVRMIIIPATQEIYKEAMRLGYIDTFIDAGAAVSTPTCGPCLGGYMGILAAGERAVSTTNRNFRGRMGHVDSEVYLASPYTAAASAITGYITSPEEVMK